MTHEQEIVDALHAIDVRLARIEERTSDLGEIEKRLSHLERWRERMIGVSMAIGALSSLLTGIVLWGLTKLFT